MSGGRMPSCPTATSGGFTSTPIKSSQRRDNRTTNGVNDDVLLDDEDTFSQLSPINYDSCDSDAELQFSPNQHTLPPRSKESRSSVSLLRCELPRTPSDQILNAAVESAGSPRLSAWEMWLVSKAKEERLKLEMISEKERILNEKREQEEREQKLKKMVMEDRIQEWLKMKKEQEKQQKLKQSKEKEEIQRQQEKQRETKQKAQQKYQNWLQKKNQEKSEMEKMEKEKAALKEEQEKKRHKRAEEKFQEWLVKANDKRRASPKPGYDPTRPYDKFCPSPSFYNPIPWKPIHTPPPEKSKIVASCTKSQKKQNPSTAIRLRNYSTAVELVPWR